MPQAWLHALPKRPSVDPKVAHILGRPSRLPVQVACDAEHAQMTAIVIRVSILDQGGASGAAPGQYQCSRKRHTGHAASGRSPRGARLRRGPGPKHTGVRSTHPTSSRSSAPVPASRAASSSNDPTNIPNPKQPKRSSSTGLELLLPPARRRPLHISTWVVGQFGGRSS